jgi:diguanylate cyclase (GGDEF)-like protein
MNPTARPTIVILEKHPRAGAALSAKLEQLGYTPRLHEDKESAVASIRAHGPRLVIAAQNVADRDFCEYVLSGTDTTAALMVVSPRGKGADNTLLPGDVHITRPLSDRTLAALIEGLDSLGDARQRKAELERQVAELGARLQLFGDRDTKTHFYHIEFFKDLLVMEIRRAKRYGYPLSICLVSLDPYELPSDQLTMASRIRAKVARAVSRSIRDIDIPVFVGQERLLVLLPHTPIDGAAQVARRLVTAVSERNGAPDTELPRVTASIGVAGVGEGDEVSFSGLMRRARQALERARQQGGDTVATCR